MGVIMSKHPYGFDNKYIDNLSARFQVLGAFNVS